MWRAAAVLALIAALWPSPVAAYPNGILHAHTATAASHKFTYGNSPFTTP